MVVLLSAPLQWFLVLRQLRLLLRLGLRLISLRHLLLSGETLHEQLGKEGSAPPSLRRSFLGESCGGSDYGLPTESDKSTCILVCTVYVFLTAVLRTSELYTRTGYTYTVYYFISLFTIKPLVQINIQYTLTRLLISTSLKDIHVKQSYVQHIYDIICIYM